MLGLIWVQDWEALYHLCGIKSFMAVPIGGAGEVLGLLTIAKDEEKAFNDEWCAAHSSATHSNAATAVLGPCLSACQQSVTSQLAFEAS